VHARKVNSSLILQRVLAYLRHRAGEPVSNIDLMFHANTPAVGTVVSELRANGYNVTCQRIQRGFFYTLHASQPTAVPA
jgi:hypothetical protein